jgi:peptidyl-prolyl cis-trans isomerase D|tara:strand:- start:21 stop:1439 length:1419 start_codon:yes stop_codon:yes gene_type:complete
MISSFRNFAKTKFAGLLVFIMIIPFVFWGMGGMFSSGNTNNIAKVNEKNISTEEFIDYLNNSGVPQEYIRENLDKEIIQELLAGLISSTLLDLEIEKLNISISKDTLLKQIKTNKNFLDENGNFQRIKYEKFLLENNQSAAGFELRLKKREEQKNLFDYIGAGTISPKFLSKKLFIEENKKLEIEFLNLKNLYAKKEDITDKEINEFIKENNDQLKVEYIDFNYVVLNPKNLIGTDDFNQTFFDKIDEIDIDISNEIDFKSIVSNLDIEPISVKNFKFSKDKNEIEKKIFELRKNKIDLFENENDYILYEIQNIDQREADINDQEIKNEIIDILVQKSKFDYNQQLLERINNKEFNRSEFSKIGKDSIQKIELNSIRDNKKFEINSVKLLYSLPINSFTLINDEENNIYLAMIKNFRNENIDTSNDNFNEFINKQNSNNKKSILKSYDMLLSDKYNITLNQKTIERVKNYFQ